MLWFLHITFISDLGYLFPGYLLVNKTYLLLFLCCSYFYLILLFKILSNALFLCTIRLIVQWLDHFFIPYFMGWGAKKTLEIYCITSNKESWIFASLSLWALSTETLLSHLIAENTYVLLYDELTSNFNKQRDLTCHRILSHIMTW